MARLPAEDKINALMDAYRERDFPAAERMARGLTRKWPGFDLGWNILSASLHARGKLDKAADAYRRALVLNPRQAELHENFGALLLQQGRLEEAEERFRESVKLEPDSSRGRANLAMALVMGESPDEAIEQARAALRLDPGNASAANTLGNALKAVDRLQDAEQAYREAIRLDPYYAKAHHNLAGVLKDRGVLEDAETHYRTAIRCDPGYARARCSLGSLLATVGRLDEAAEAYRGAIEAHPALAEAHRYLAWIKTFQQPDEDLNRIQQALAGRSSDADRAQLHYAAGKACQDLGDRPREAFSHFAKGAALRRREYRYDVGVDERLFADIAAAYPASVTAAAGPAAAGPVPVFIVGMPRCGSTLVEQILAAHSGVLAHGESQALPQLTAALGAELGGEYPDWAGRLTAPQEAGLEDRYLRAHGDPHGARAVTDKMLDNFKYLGLIAAAMPRARIVHAVRSPLDTCLSCFTQYFSSPVPYSYDLLELGRYYRAYYGLMQHWRRVLPAGRMLEVEYEALTRDPETQARRIVEHCGLEWESGCLDFHDTRRPIETASVAQARQEVHRRSVGRWSSYREFMQPLIAELADLAY